MNSVNTATPMMDDESLAMLLDEVTVLAASERPLTLALADLEDAAMGKIGRAARTVRERLEQGQPASVAIAALSQTYQAPIRGAMQVMARTGSTQPLRETVRLIRDANERRRQLGLATINPLLSLIVSAAVAFLVIPWILVSLAEAELIKTAFSPTVVEISQTLVRQSTLVAAIMLLVIAVMGAFFVAWQRRVDRDNDAAGEQARFCRWLAMQIANVPSSGVGAGQAIEMAAEVVGGRFAASWTPVLENIRGGSQSAESLAMPESTFEPVGQCIVDLVAARRDRESIAIDLQRLSESYTAQSRRRRTWWIETVPKSIAGIVMIGVIVVLVQAIIAPLLEVIGEVGT